MIKTWCNLECEDLDDIEKIRLEKGKFYYSIDPKSQVGYKFVKIILRISFIFLEFNDKSNHQENKLLRI